MKHKNNKKAHDELAYAYYEQLMKNERLERIVAMYKKLLEKHHVHILDAESATDFISKA